MSFTRVTFFILVIVECALTITSIKSTVKPFVTKVHKCRTHKEYLLRKLEKQTQKYMTMSYEETEEYMKKM